MTGKQTTRGTAAEHVVHQGEPHRARQGIFIFLTEEQLNITVSWGVKLRNYDRLIAAVESETTVAPAQHTVIDCDVYNRKRENENVDVKVHPGKQYLFTIPLQ